MEGPRPSARRRPAVQANKPYTDERIADALLLIGRHAGTDDPACLAWLIEQIVRTIAGTAYYEQWVAFYESRGKTWDRGHEP